MKRISFLMIALLLIGGVVMAQGYRRGNREMNPRVRAERMAERMAKEYSLTDAQKNQVMEANLIMMEQMGNYSRAMKPGKGYKAYRTDSCYCGKYKHGKRQVTKMSKTDREKMRQEMTATRDAYNARLQKIMTKDQYAAYIKNQAERQQKMKDKRR